MNKAEIYYREKYSLPKDEFPTLGFDDVRIIKLMNDFLEEQKKSSIPRVIKSFYCLDENIKGSKHKCKTICDNCDKRQHINTVSVVFLGLCIS